MQLPLELHINLQVDEQVQFGLWINSGMTTILGPNGSGKTSLLRCIQERLQPHIKSKEVRFLSAGRAASIEKHRSNVDGDGRTAAEDARFGTTRGETRRHKAESFIGDFQTLASRPDVLIKVQERLSKLFDRELELQWDHGDLRVFFRQCSGKRSRYAGAHEASGLLQLVGLLTAVYDDGVGALLIDEPEVSLHPQLQAFLLAEMQRVAGWPSTNNKKLIIIATHSTEMLDVSVANDLCDIVFCDHISRPPRQLIPTEDILKDKRIQALVNSLGQSHRSAFFARRPLLVEGPSDAVICKAVARAADIHLEAAGSCIVPVDGKGKLDVVAKLFRMVGKAPVVLADADAFADDSKLIGTYISTVEARSIMAEMGGGANWARDIFNEFCRLADDHSMELNASVNELDRTARRRLVFVTLNRMTEEMLAEIPGNQWSDIKNRITALLGVLNQLGCFILQRGSVEAYYMSSFKSQRANKIEDAIAEIQVLKDSSKQAVRDAYGDVLRCLEFAANTVAIDETSRVIELLLAIAAPCKFRSDSATTESIRVLAESILGQKADIFDLHAHEGKITVSLRSEILEVQGFPVVIASSDDVVQIINNGLRKP